MCMTLKDYQKTLQYRKQLARAYRESHQDQRAAKAQEEIDALEAMVCCDACGGMRPKRERCSMTEDTHSLYSEE